KILTKLSEFWFHKLDFFPNHFITSNPNHFPTDLLPVAPYIAGRSMLVKKAIPLPIECIVRGWLTGSAWKEYLQSGTVCGQALPSGLQHASRLDSPIFTPTTKALSGHDQPLSWRDCRSLIGDELAHQVRKISIELYEHARDYAISRGIVIADTKFEFGLYNGELILIDELLTPDSSRFWPAESVKPGAFPPSFDKQFVRDWLESSGWNKQPPPPSLPPEIVERTAAKYSEAYRMLCE
ncbi:MAG: phosphoribosylaminoimidazolesuccinocarboxamide synthase, partial [Chthoniobacterales bacterium]|nr:phosphoribosylaminoimidazolesuccinocarboxamide synthase [Chthoniobacterales bacterium]